MSIQHGETEAEGNQKVYSLSLPDRTGSQTFTVANWGTGVCQHPAPPITS